MLISSYQERYARSTEKIRVLLNFLKEETYSDFQIIKLLFDFKSDRPLYRLLEKVEKMGLIQKHVHESRASRISLWGITADGLAVILTADDNIMPARFEPYRLTGWSLDHHLDNQLVRLTLEKNGATGWINGDRSTFLSQYSVKHRPDGLISLPDGRLIAVENERRIKTKKGLIGHTQPRRLAARTVANRIAEELQSEPGGCIGYKVRFSDHVSENTMVKLMTDGILLAEIQQDRLLMQYDTIIIDEAHERSLNIDFLLGYLKELLPRRPDLKIIITSATIDPERFSKHFNNAPIIEVSGRTYPVEVRYRPIVEEADDTERDQLQAIFDAVDELGREGPGDILIFMSGEREIRDTADALNKLDLRHTEVLHFRSSTHSQYFDTSGKPKNAAA